ncbi:hypothetical protein O3G_MSEX002379 [Manduca sexta]|uniref:CCHC-type domain-containing protein n=1 Tax=Manduca sexta TaxID=7130 RepID=A0A921YNM5_MANSE|nr:hypothetical protein O3G_MSEX002379 [Manduca sexta]
MSEPRYESSTMFQLVEGNITKFSGDDKTYSSGKWALDIEENAEIFGWSDQQRLIMARRSLTGTAALWLRSEKIHKTFNELKTAVLKEFPDVINVKEMHEMMSSRKKRRDETYYQYMLTMKELGKRAKFPDYVSIQYIIDGIVDNPVNKTILYGVTTYPSLKEKLIIYENIKKTQLSINKESSSRSSSYTAQKPGSSTLKRCYNCGDLSHEASACATGIKCFRCNQFGHISQHCTQNGGQEAFKKTFVIREPSSAIGRHEQQRNVGNKVELQRKMPNDVPKTQSRQVYYNSAQDGATKS